MEQEKATILPLLYLGNIQYWTKLVHPSTIIINDFENYPKGSYRNRCHILSSHGLLRLSIPLLSGKHAGQKYKEVKIDNKENWQKTHWQSICSCYGSAPFFQHYEEKLKRYYHQPYQLLWDWNLELTMELLQWIKGEDLNIKFLTKEENYYSKNDLTHFFSPKPRFINPDFEWQSIEYPQVFENKVGFISNGSILDLVFCQGPYAIQTLRNGYLSGKNNN